MAMPVEAQLRLPGHRRCCLDEDGADEDRGFNKPKEVVKTHHNQAATLASNKNASKSVRDKLKAQQAAAAAIIAAEANKGTKPKQFTAKANGPSTI